MKHFIGGSALGFFIGMGFVEAGEDKPTACCIFALLFGVAAWGLLP